MRLSIAAVLATAGSSLAIPLTDQPSANPAQSDLHGAFSQVNATHVQFDITNPANRTVSLLKQHNILHAGAEHFSLQVRPVANNSQVEPPGPGDGAVRYIYSRSVGNDSFVQIPAGSHWTHTFDITRTFMIPAAGAYNISLNGNFAGAYAASGKNDMSSTDGLSPIHVECQPVTFKLAASSQTAMRRRSNPAPDALAGCASSRTQLTATIKAATSMANDALSALSNNPQLLKIYFGLVKGQSEGFFATFFEIQETFVKISAYDPTKDTHITWNCASNPGSSLSGCTGSVIGYYLYSAKSINLCSIYDTIPQSLGCTQPNFGVQALDEQDGTVLHELFHDRTFAPQNILDFPDPNNPGKGCYNYNCAAGFATARASNTLPERSAINYEQFSEDARYAAHPNAPCVSAGGGTLQTPPMPPTAAQANSYGPPASTP